MRQKKIDRVLKDLYESSIYLIQNGQQLTEQIVYNYLKKLGLPKEERNKNIKELFPEWIEYFKNTPNIGVYNSPDWKYFCQFTNGKVPLECIKMYISLDSSHIEKGAKLIFDFLAENNIVHLSKIGSEIRTDGIVIRVTNKEDALKIQKYIDSSEFLQEGLQEVNPFCYENNKIGYVYDGHSSYNSFIAYLIANYINQMIEQGIPQNQINTNSFYQYVDSFSKDLSKVRTLPYIYGINERINEAVLTLGSIKLSLGSNDINGFFKYYDYIIGTAKENTNIPQSKEELAKEMILTTMKKYPKGYNSNDPEDSGFYFIKHYLEGNINGITRDNNLRERVKDNLSIEDLINIAINYGSKGANNLEIIINYIKMIMLNEMIRCSSVKFPNHGIDQVQMFLNTGEIKYITKSISNARALAKTLDPSEILELLNILKVNSIYQYAELYYSKINTRKQK